MAVRKIQPVCGGLAMIAALTAAWTAPVLAAPDRSLCDEPTAPTLAITATEFSVTADADASIELIGPNFELASREASAREDEELEQTESAAEEDAGAESSDATVPAEGGPLVHKRQMYRRDI
jgi:hypothetical protein